MATITTNTFLDDGIARTAGEVWTMNGGILTIRTDTRWHSNSPAGTVGSLGSLTISSSLGGGVLVDARNIRWMSFDTGSGNVPAIGTIITQGGVSGYLLGVWTSLNTAPVSVGSPMPTTGFLKFREVTGGSFTIGALTDIGANATEADRVGWIEVVHDQAAAITVPRLGFYRTRGDWFELGITTGTSNQIVQIPTNGGGTGTRVPAIWIETSAGSGQYESYPAVSSTYFTATNMSTDIRSKFVFMDTGGIVRIGSDGTTNIGYIPEAGCKIRIPNILGRQTSAVNRGLNLVPSSTLSTRPDFNTTSAGEIDIEFLMNDWYHLFASPYKVRVVNSATMDIHSTSNEASPTYLENYVLGVYQTSGQLLYTGNLLGGDLINCKFFRADAVSNGHSISMTNSSGYNLTNIETGVITFARSSGAILFTNCREFTITGLKKTSVQMNMSTCANISITNSDHCDRFIGTTTTTSGIYAFTTSNACDNIKVDGLTFGKNNVIADMHPYTGLFQSTACSNITFRNVGTSVSPLLITVNLPASIFVDGGVNDTIRVQNIYLSATRSSLYTTVNTSKNITFERLTGTTGAVVTSSINTIVKGVRSASNSVTGQSAVYGTHWFDMFESDTLGRIWLAFNEPTSFTTSQYEAVSLGAGAGFTSTGLLVMPNVGDQIIYTMPYLAIGHTGFQNVAPTVTATNAANFTLEYQVDTGNGFSGIWQTLNATNLSAEIVTASIGVALKIRVTTITANPTNSLTYIRVSTTSTLLAQQATSYPLDYATVKIIGLTPNSRVQIFDLTNTLEVYNSIVTTDTLEYKSPFINDYIARIRVMYTTSSTANNFIEFDDVVTLSGLTRVVIPSIDSTYVTNGIDGFSITGITINDNALLIETDTGTLSWAEIYAYETAWLYSEEGIRDEIRFITAIDAVNYELVGFKIKNISTPSIPLIITGGWGKDSVTKQTSTIIDTTGGMIFSNPDLVIPVDVGSGLSPEQDAKLSRIKINTDLIPATL